MCKGLEHKLQLVFIVGP